MFFVVIVDVVIVALQQGIGQFLGQVETAFNGLLLFLDVVQCSGDCQAFFMERKIGGKFRVLDIVLPN